MPRITKTSYTTAFQQIASTALAHGEKNDCSVKAATILCDISYDHSLAVFELCGRKPRSATPYHVTMAAYDHLGYKLIPIPLRPIIDSYPSPHNTMKNVTTHQPRRFEEQWEPYSKGGYLMHTRNHVLAMRNGLVHCWSINSALRVIHMWKVEPK